MGLFFSPVTTQGFVKGYKLVISRDPVSRTLSYFTEEINLIFELGSCETLKIRCASLQIYL